MINYYKNSKNGFLITGLVFLLFLGACGVKKKSVSSDTIDVIKTDIVTKPQIAEISIESRKVEGSAEVRKKDYYPNPREACMNLALNDAMKKGNCDIVVRPMYEIEESGSYISVKVSGFAGHYKKFRDLQDSDTTAFKVYDKVAASLNKATIIEKGKKRHSTEGKSGKSGRGAVRGVLLGLGLLLGLIVIASI